MTMTTSPPTHSPSAEEAEWIAADVDEGMPDALLCVVCDDAADGVHFGQYTCRACAAFFRRSVSLRLEYACRFDNNCEVVKDARNMCRACRYQKCLAKGMLPSAVQHSRDSLGKRKELSAVKKVSESGTSLPSTSDYNTDTSASTHWSPEERTSPPKANGQFNGFTNGHSEDGLADMHLSRAYFNVVPNVEMKVLNRMVDGYHNFLSLRRASYALIDVIPRYTSVDNEIPISNYDTSKKLCKMERSLAFDMVTKYFPNFDLVDDRDKMRMYETFFCHFSNSERAYTTYRRFGHIPNNDKLIMPDGGYISINDIQSFYENNNSVRGDPAQLARIFGDIYTYVVKFVVSDMARIQMDEYELIALLGIFLWRDTIVDLQPETISMVFSMREDVLRDLYIHYRQLGIVDTDCGVRMGSLFLLVPKLEQTVRLMKENYCIAELFNMLEIEQCCKSNHEA